MQYIALIYCAENPEFDPASPAAQANFQAYGEFTKKIIANGQFKGGDPLLPSATATCVTRRNGKVATTDGPYAETKEQLAGYYLLECADLDEAVATAAEIPDADSGVIEVRPVMQM